MTRIRLVNMPFALPDKPSIALTQLRYVLNQTFGNAVKTEIDYLNLSFASYFGWDLYCGISNSMAAQVTGFGDWLFRRCAFPERPDNSSEFFGRYRLHFQHYAEVLGVVRQKLLGLESYLDSLIDRHDLASADIVGFTSMFQQTVPSIAMARRLKLRNPGITILVGGANCEAPMGEQIVQNVPYIDFVFSGAALKSLPEFVRRYRENDLDGCRRINGVHSRRNAAMRMPSQPVPPLVPLTSRPAVLEMGEETDVNAPMELDYDTFLEAYERVAPPSAAKPALTFETSRGCWWGEKAQCTFCGLNGVTMQYRAMTSQKALGLIESLFKYSGRVRELMAVDNILPKEYYKQVLPYLRTPDDLQLFYELKADLSDEDFQALARARVNHTQPGIEALATSTLKLMKKGTNAFQNLQFLLRCIKYKVFPEWNLLVGFPGEKDEVYRKYVEDIPSLVHLPPPSGVWPVRFDRYSPYFVQAESYGLKLKPLDYYRLIYPFSEEVLSAIAYYFMDTNFAAEHSRLMGIWLTKLQKPVEKWIALWSDPAKAGPRLKFADGGETVMDSRSGVSITHKLDEIEVWLLAKLAQPGRRPDLEAEGLRHFGTKVTDRIESLSHRGLVFAESDRMISLIEPKAKSPDSEENFQQLVKSHFSGN